MNESCRHMSGNCSCLFLSFFKILFLSWLHWVLVAACGFSLVAASGGLLFVAVHGLLICGGFSCCGAQALGAWVSVVAAHGLQ